MPSLALRAPYPLRLLADRNSRDRSAGIGDGRSGRAAPVSNQFVDGDDRQTELSRDFHQLVSSSHIDSIATADFAENASRGQTRQASQIDGRLGVPRPPQHPFGLGDQGEQVARPNEIGWAALLVEDRANSVGPLLRADTGLIEAMVYRDC